MTNLFLSDDQIFYTVEGEGELIGHPSVFMRLSMCNLTCIGFKSPDAPFGCDSFVSWSKKNKYNLEEVIKLLDEGGFTKRLKAGAIWKITGGEPLIQQTALLELVQEFRNRHGFIPNIDFETNGTLQPSEEWFDEYCASFTVSPKLASNGDPEDKRFKPDVLSWHARHYSCFKFVVRNKEDAEEVMNKYVNNADILVPLERIWFMPCAGSRQELVNISAEVAELAKDYGVKFSTRLHLTIWDKALKV